MNDNDILVCKVRISDWTVGLVRRNPVTSLCQEQSVRPTYSSSPQLIGAMKLNLLLLLVLLGLLCYGPATSQPVENMKAKRSPQDEGAESTTPVWCNFSSPFRSV